MNNQMPNFMPGFPPAGPGPMAPPIWNNQNMEIRQLENRVTALEREVRRLNNRVSKIERSMNYPVPLHESENYQSYQTDSYNMM